MSDNTHSFNEQVLKGMAEENRQPISPQMKQIAKRVFVAREQRHINQRDLAKQLGISQPMMSQYERGERRIPSDLLATIINILGESADTVLFGTSKTPRPVLEIDDEMKKTWKKFQQVMELPEDDQRAVIRLINSVAKAKPKTTRRVKL